MTININSGNVPTTAAQATQNCDPNQGGGPFVGMDVWVFVLPGMHSTSGDFVSITAHFNDGDVTITAAGNPSNFSNGGPDTAKAWIVTTAGRTLTGASAEITGTADSFNLTHACAGTQTTPTPPVETTPPVTETTPPGDGTSPPRTDPGTPSGGVSSGGGGSQSGGGLFFGITALAVATAAGGVLFLAWRRRNSA